jgi:hypothetical protein
MRRAPARPSHGLARARRLVAVTHLSDHAVATVRRVLAIVLAAAVAAPAVAVDSCVVAANSREDVECCRPSTTHDSAQLTCCIAPDAVSASVSAWDSQRDDGLVAAALEVPWYSAPTAPSTLLPAAALALRESGAGPPLVPMRI